MIYEWVEKNKDKKESSSFIIFHPFKI